MSTPSPTPSAPSNCTQFKNRFWNKSKCINCDGKKEQHSEVALAASSTKSPSSSPKLSPRSSPRSFQPAAGGLDYDQIEDLIGKGLRASFMTGNLQDTSKGLGLLIDMIKSLKLDKIVVDGTNLQSHFFTKISKNIIANIDKNIEMTGNIIICYLLTHIDTMISVDDSLTVDPFTYQPHGNADIRVIGRDYMRVIYKVMAGIYDELEELTKQQNDELDEKKEMYFGLIGCGGLASITANVLGRCAELRHTLWSHHTSPTNKQDIDFLKEMDELRDILTYYRHDSKFLLHSINTLDDEIITVIHLQAQWGARICIRGITVNDQLAVMLTDVLYQNYATITAKTNGPPPPFERPSKQVMDVMTGVGPQELPRGNYVKYEFAMYNWYGPQRFDDPSISGSGYICSPFEIMDTRLWGEGIPFDIAPCPYISADGRTPINASRVIILDTQTKYNRASNVCRDFGVYPAECRFVNALSSDEVRDIMTRITAVSPYERKVAIDENKLRINEQELNIKEANPALERTQAYMAFKSLQLTR